MKSPDLELALQTLSELGGVTTVLDVLNALLNPIIDPVTGLLPLDWANEAVPGNLWVDPEPQRYQD